MTLAQVAREATARYRFRALMVVTFAGLALILAMVGVFGVLAYSVQQRMREFGVRIALGATTTHVLGLGAGQRGTGDWRRRHHRLGLAMALAQMVATFLFGVPPRDPLTFAAVTIVLAITAASPARCRPSAPHELTRRSRSERSSVAAGQRRRGSGCSLRSAAISSSLARIA